MIHEIREKNLFQTIKQSAKEIGYKTVGAYAFMAVLFLVISVTFVLTQHQQDIRQHAAGNFPLLTVTGVSISHSSAKIKYNSVAGASDYRVYDITDPNNVKYAGLVHPGGQTSPATEVEWNTLLDNLPHTLIVEAVDTLGPVPPGNQYTSDNIAKVNPLPAGAMLGSNAGLTPDGKRSTNGQGPSTNSPNVIAQSQPFIVQANQSFLSIPSSPNTTQTFFDTFDDSQAGTLTQTVAPDDSRGTMRYTLNAGTDKAWDIYYTDADVKNSMPFIKNGHFMDMLFDGGTPGSNNPLHQTYAAMFMSPQKSVDFSNGQILHMTMDVDSHTDSRRWIDFQLSPADALVRTAFACPDASASVHHPPPAIRLYLREPENFTDDYLPPQTMSECEGKAENVCSAHFFSG